MRKMRKYLEKSSDKSTNFVHKNTKEMCWNGFSRIIEQKQK